MAKDQSAVAILVDDNIDDVDDDDEEVVELRNGFFEHPRPRRRVQTLQRTESSGRVCMLQAKTRIDDGVRYVEGVFEFERHPNPEALIGDKFPHLVIEEFWHDEVIFGFVPQVDSVRTWVDENQSIFW